MRKEITQVYDVMIESSSLGPLPMVLRGSGEADIIKRVRKLQDTFKPLVGRLTVNSIKCREDYR